MTTWTRMCADAAYLSEIRSLAHPLRNAADLDPLVERLATNRFVCLGEASHRTHEYYRWRATLSRRLIEEHGFTWIGVHGRSRSYSPTSASPNPTPDRTSRTIIDLRASTLNCGVRGHRQVLAEQFDRHPVRGGGPVATDASQPTGSAWPAGWRGQRAPRGEVSVRWPLLWTVSEEAV